MPARLKYTRLRQPQSMIDPEYVVAGLPTAPEP